MGIGKCRLTPHRQHPTTATTAAAAATHSARYDRASRGGSGGGSGACARYARGDGGGARGDWLLMEMDAMTETTISYGYYWFRHHQDGSTFIACRDEGDGLWYMAGVGHPILDPEKHATMLGKVPRAVVGGGSIDQ